MEPLGIRERRASIGRTMQDERRHVNGGQHRAEVALRADVARCPNRAGRMISRIIVANAASRSGGMSSENKPGYDLGSNASPNSAMPRNISSRRATSCGGNEPAQPA